MHFLIHHFVLTIACIATLGVCVVPILGQSAISRITGLVKDVNGQSVIGAEVALTTHLNVVIKTMATDASGNFTIDNVNPGNYVLVVSSTGFAAKRIP